MKKIFVILFMSLSFFAEAQEMDMAIVAGIKNREVRNFCDSVRMYTATAYYNLDRLVYDFKGYNNQLYTTINIWDSMVAIYPFVTSNDTVCSFNLKNVTIGKLIFVGSPTFTDTGVTNNASSYARTGILATYPASINSLHFTSAQRHNFIASASMGSSASVASRIAFSPYGTGNLIIADVFNNSTERVTSSNSNGRGIFSFSRIAANDLRIFRNASQTAINSNVRSAVPPALEMALMGVNVTGLYTGTGTGSSYSYFDIGYGLTATQINFSHTAINNFLRNKPVSQALY